MTSRCGSSLSASFEPPASASNPHPAAGPAPDFHSRTGQTQQRDNQSNSHDLPLLNLSASRRRARARDGSVEFRKLTMYPETKDNAAHDRLPQRSTVVTGSTCLAVDPRYPNAAFERLEAHAHGLDSACHLGAAADFTLGKIGPYQINQGGAGLAGLRRRQRMRKDARLNIIRAASNSRSHRALKRSRTTRNRTQGIVRHIARSSRPPNEAQVQQAADAATFVMAGTMQALPAIRLSSGRARAKLDRCPRDDEFREMFCRQVRTLCFYSNDAARRSHSGCQANHGFSQKGVPGSLSEYFAYAVIQFMPAGYWRREGSGRYDGVLCIDMIRWTKRS